MKGTRLWQATGSPLIQGRSAHVRPFWQPWSGGAIASALLYAGGYALYAHATNALAIPWAYVVPGCVVGAAPGVWVARRMGASNAWIAGVAGGLVGSFLVWLALGQ